MPLIVSVALPVLAKLTLCAALDVPLNWLANVRVEVERLATGATPVPVSGIVWGLPAASSTMAIAPTAGPIAVGAKVTWMEQLAPAPREAGQLFD
jgi:hypothetical protein